MNDWNSFMQTRKARIVLYGLCVFFCVFYAIDAVREMLNPERAGQMIEAMGETTFYIVDVIRAIVCLGTGVAFARIVLKIMREEDDN